MDKINKAVQLIVFILKSEPELVSEEDESLPW